MLSTTMSASREDVKRPKWQLRVLLLALLTVISFESASVSFFSSVSSSPRRGLLDFTVELTLVEVPRDIAPRRLLTEAQHRDLQAFHEQHPWLWNQSDAILLEQSPSFYYAQFGMYQYQFYAPLTDDSMERRKAMFLIDREEPTLIGDARVAHLYEGAPKSQRQLQFPQKYPETSDTDTWVLANPLKHSTRNHDSIVLERATGNPDSIAMVSILGRSCRYVQSLDLVTGLQWSERTENMTDPAGMPLDDLNHVSAVLVESLDEERGQEIWLPCGFHNDRVNSEVSARYARIVDVATLQIRTGPKLPVAGGACVAAAVPVLLDEPPMICSFGGTQGTHDRGKFLKETACFDRRRSAWWTPFGNLPYGLDHGSLAMIPAGTCASTDPARIVILNFRTKPYGDAHPEMLAHDLPKAGWALDDLRSVSHRNETQWYVYYSGKDNAESKNVARDASGTIVVDGGRHIVNFGGTYHYYLEQKKRKRGRISMIRSFDVCQKEWSVIGDLGLQTFALQTAASQELQLAVTCGGEAPMHNGNGHWCFANRFHNGMRLSNRFETSSRG